MNGILLLLILIITAALPAIIVYILFRVTKSPVTLPWFLVFLVTGVISLLAAVLVQKLFPPPGIVGIWSLFFSVFIRIALVEETGRLVGFAIFLNIIKSYRNQDKPFCAALGFISGLGFAMIESVFYGISDLNIILLRAVTAAPLHGACGIRVSIAYITVRDNPIKAIFLFISAVLIHGAYNLIILSPAFPALLAIPIAFAALFPAIHYLKVPNKDD